VLLQLLVLFGVPCAMRSIHVNGGRIGPREFYALWWLLALLPALAEVLARFDPWRETPRDESGRGQAAPTRTYLVLPYVSLLVHISILHYVYDVRFYGAHVAPLLLGLTLALNHLNPMTLIPRRDVRALRLLLPAAAVLVSMNNPFVIWRLGFSYPTVPHTPLAAAVAGAFLVYVYCFLWERAWLFLTAGGLAEVAYMFGPNREHVTTASKVTMNWTADTAERLAPRTLADWGVIGLVASFAFLAIGFWVSLRKRGPETIEGDAGA
jgi:hypothetical protein